MESNDLSFLDRVVEKTYQLLYQKLQFDHVVTFCQSECYLGYLCGSPPESVEELIEPNIPEKSASGKRQAFSLSSQSSFSFSQFRSRLWSVIIPTSTDGSIDECGSDISSGYYSTSSKGIELGDEAACVVGSLATNISAVRYPSSSPENFSVPAIDVTMADDVTDEGFIVPPVNTDVGKPQSGELICEKRRDMSRWRVQIPRIEPRRDSNGRTLFVYVISVERSDIEGEITPRKWELVRRYHEFYILESKLMEFHGDLIRTEPLPPKRTLRTKNREFIESVRLQFERNLQLLTQQSVLKRSDLLAVFLSGEEEIANSAVFSMSNTWKVVKKVPGKFSREKGQHVKPFLLHMMAVVLAPADVQKAEFGANGKPEMKSESSSISSISFEQPVNNPKQVLSNSIFGNNCPTSCATSTLFDYAPWTRSVCQALMFLMQRSFQVSSTFSCLLLSVIGFFRCVVDKVIVNFLGSVLDYSLNDSNVVQLVQLLQKALFSAEEGLSTEQEKVMRAELAQRRTVEYLQDQLPSAFVQGMGKKRFRRGVQNLFSTLQHPRLNKQLSFVLLDLLVKKLFPEFRT
uniref:PX domain-containing protein n=1 Tax=Steinernema glaseri TaxID=37863 RepID=A0A1I7YM95_9BILA